jgi:hypothetical protein
MLLFALAVIFVQTMILHGKEILEDGDQLTLLSELESVKNGGKKVIEFKVSDKESCELICEKDWLKTFCAFKSQCGAISECKTENCTCKLKLACAKSEIKLDSDIVSEIVVLKPDSSSFEVPVVQEKRKKMNPKIGMYRTLKTEDVR